MKKHLSHGLLLAAALSLIHSAFAQTTKNLNVNVSGTSTITGAAIGSGSGSGTVNPLGNAAVTVSSTQGVDTNFNPTGPVQGTITFAFNRLDSFTVTASLPDLTTVNVATFTGTISGGQGAYNGAS